MSIKTIRKACFLTMFIGFGILPSLSWGGDVTSMSKGAIGRIDKDGRIYDGSNSPIGRIYKDGGIVSDSKGYIGRIDKDGSVYNGSYSFIGRVDPGDIVGALYLLKDKF